MLAFIFHMGCYCVTEVSTTENAITYTNKCDATMDSTRGSITIAGSVPCIFTMPNLSQPELISNLRISTYLIVDCQDLTFINCYTEFQFIYPTSFCSIALQHQEM